MEHKDESKEYKINELYITFSIKKHRADVKYSEKFLNMIETMGFVYDSEQKVTFVIEDDIVALGYKSVVLFDVMEIVRILLQYNETIQPSEIVDGWADLHHSNQ